MTTAGYMIAAVCALLAGGYACSECYRLGHQKGFADGHKAGKIDADNWWITTELQVDQERQKIWREEES